MATSATPVGGIVTSTGIPWAEYEKGLNALTKKTLDSVDESIIDRIYRRESIQDLEIRKRSYNGLTDATHWGANGQVVPKSTMASGYLIVAENRWVGNSFGYTLDMKMNDRNGIMPKVAAELPKTVANKRLQDAIAFLVGGFATYWNAEAAEYLFTATHKMDTRYVGGTISNLVTGGPSISAYSDAVELLIATPDPLGSVKTYKPSFLLCHESKVTEWQQVLGFGGASGMRSDTANHTPNPINGNRRAEIVGCSHKDFPTSYWFLFSDEKNLVWNDRVKSVTWMDTAADTVVTTHYVRSNYCRYAEDWRGIVGSTG